jgi:hypothetical protein
MHANADAAIDSSRCSIPETENCVAKVVPIDDEARAAQPARDAHDE